MISSTLSKTGKGRRIERGITSSKIQKEEQWHLMISQFRHIFWEISAAMLLPSRDKRDKNAFCKHTFSSLACIYKVPKHIQFIFANGFLNILVSGINVWNLELIWGWMCAILSSVIWTHTDTQNNDFSLSYLTSAVHEWFHSPSILDSLLLRSVTTRPCF